MSTPGPFELFKAAMEFSDIPTMNALKAVHGAEIASRFHTEGIAVLQLAVQHNSIHYPELTDLIDWVLAHLTQTISHELFARALTQSHYNICFKSLRQPNAVLTAPANQVAVQENVDDAPMENLSASFERVDLKRERGCNDSDDEREETKRWKPATL